mmetsp:Transcript_75189/g.168765  ORF Transcript_75189/g.168765 Transcript_75189/m.168765 type:complete len:141 (-) Transcript_75189:238-660(-)
MIGRAPSRTCSAIILPLGGQVSRRPPEATANPHRSMQAWILISGAWKPGDSDMKPKAVQWVRETKAAMLPFSKGAQYGVLAEVEVHGDEDDVGAIGCFMNTVEILSKRNIYGVNLPRLRELKAKYDPRNLFRINDNILPQ